MLDTDLGVAMYVAERLRANVAGERFTVSAPVGEVLLTLSLGVIRAVGPSARSTR